MEFITLSEALKTIRNGDSCTVTYVKADLKRKTGGEIKTINVMMLKSQSSNDVGKSLPKKQQDESQNLFPAVINLWEPLKKRPTAVHTRLITAFNGKQVVY